MTGRVEAKLAAMGLELPEPFAYPSANRTGCVETGSLLFVSGHPPPAALGAAMRGKVDAEIPEDEAYDTARKTALNIFASVQRHLGSLDRVRRVVKINGYVNSSPGFERQFAVIDGASDLLYELYPEAHARTAVGVAELPRGFPIEIEAVFEIG
ncbi:MAG: RidA family protein [Defluviicoccus sp.]|nr:RidA family protein [Defluviicoccus sp.]MDE0277969.1 RidA family protein [Defluviicoccus sp.]